MENTLIINGLKLFSYHGVNQEEKTNGQNFIIDIEIKTKRLTGYKNDNLDDVLNYSNVIKQVTNFFTHKTYNLIEKAAEDTVENLFKTFNEIEEITLTLKKPEAPISANFEFVAIKISRKRSDYIG